MSPTVPFKEWALKSIDQRMTTKERRQKMPFKVKPYIIESVEINDISKRVLGGFENDAIPCNNNLCSEKRPG